MKVKLKNKEIKMPMWDSYCGLNTDDWEKLNAGETVSIDKIPKFAIPYLEKLKKER